MALFFRLLIDALPKLGRAFRDFAYGYLAWSVAGVLEAHAPHAPQEIVQQPPVLSQEQEALLSELHQHMAARFQVQILEQNLLCVLRYDGL